MSHQECEAQRAEDQRETAPNDVTLHPKSVAVTGWEICFKEGTKTYAISCSSSTKFPHDAGKSQKPQTLPLLAARPVRALGGCAEFATVERCRSSPLPAFAFACKYRSSHINVAKCVTTVRVTLMDSCAESGESSIHRFGDQSRAGERVFQIALRGVHPSRPPR